MKGHDRDFIYIQVLESNFTSNVYVVNISLKNIYILGWVIAIGSADITSSDDIFRRRNTIIKNVNSMLDWLNIFVMFCVASAFPSH